MIAIVRVKCKCGNWVRFRITENGTYTKRCWGSMGTPCARDVTLKYAGRAQGIVEGDKNRPVDVDLQEN